MAGETMDFFDTLASNPFMNAMLYTRALPVLCSAITPDNTDKAALSAAIDLLKSLIRGGPSPLPAGYVAQFFPHLIAVLLTVNDRDVLQVLNYTAFDDASTFRCLTVTIALTLG